MRVLPRKQIVYQFTSHFADLYLSQADGEHNPTPQQKETAFKSDQSIRGIGGHK